MTGKAQLPLPILNRVAEAAADTRLPLYAIYSFATIARYANPDGSVGLDENGQPMSSWSTVAAHVGAAHSTIRKAFATLEKTGYIRWDRAWSPERGGFDGTTSKVSILLPDQTQ